MRLVSRTATTALAPEKNQQQTIVASMTDTVWQSSCKLDGELVLHLSASDDAANHG